MGKVAFQKKGLGYSFQQKNLKAIVNRIIDTSKSYHGHFRVGSHTVAPAADTYLNGLLMKAPRSMEVYFQSADYETVQHFISKSPSDEKPVKVHIAADVDGAIGSPHRMPAIDENVFTKKRLYRKSSIGELLEWHRRRRQSIESAYRRQIAIESIQTK